MTFTRRAVRNAAAAAGIALTMAPTQPARTNATILNRQLVTGDGKVNCDNYIGTCKLGTYVVVVDWQAGNGDECFGIAPNRTIWDNAAGDRRHLRTEFTVAARARFDRVRGGKATHCRSRHQAANPARRAGDEPEQ
ncbi:hypothetical protein [Amycolatopsis sp. WQ 127309]|uniref:hypothetical protein n=1 Tax=Amycolatopsis sp. WQ 127309 TaxID=2932773 RepID=UPI001FF687AA|nr:hypothetical protein [Amycolatopsis sp. WQ 127309]UOZ05510.1 hypothetical protein MUY22_42880 [Amycolatopsis sp. WQ 127309]